MKIKSFICSILFAIFIWFISPYQDVRATEIVLGLLLGNLYGKD